MTLSTLTNRYERSPRSRFIVSDHQHNTPKKVSPRKLSCPRRATYVGSPHILKAPPQGSWKPAPPSATRTRSCIDRHPVIVTPSPPNPAKTPRSFSARVRHAVSSSSTSPEERPLTAASRLQQASATQITTQISPRIVLNEHGRPRIRMFSRDGVKLFRHGGCSASVVRRTIGGGLGNAIQIREAVQRYCPSSCSGFGPLWILQSHSSEVISYVRQQWRNHNHSVVDRSASQSMPEKLLKADFYELLVTLGCSPITDLLQRIFSLSVYPPGKASALTDKKTRGGRTSIRFEEFLQGVKALLFMPNRKHEHLQAMFCFFDEDRCFPDWSRFRHGSISELELQECLQYSVALSAHPEQIDDLVESIFQSPRLRECEKNWVYGEMRQRKLSYIGFTKAIKLFPTMISLFKRS